MEPLFEALEHYLVTKRFEGTRLIKFASEITPHDKVKTSRFLFTESRRRCHPKNPELTSEALNCSIVGLTAAFNDQLTMTMLSNFC